MPLEIEPDGQQFLDARNSVETGPDADATERPPPPPPPAPRPPAQPDRDLRTTTLIVVGVVIAVVLIGGVAIFRSSGAEEGDRKLETGGASITVGHRADDATPTTEEPKETTTTAPPTTVPPTTNAQPAPPPPNPDSQPGNASGSNSNPPPSTGPSVTCPTGSGVASTVTSQDYRQGAKQSSVDIQGTSTNNTSATVIVELTVLVTHNAPGKPNPLKGAVSQVTSPLPPGQTSRWRYTVIIDSATSASLSGLTGGFRWLDEAFASACPTG